MLHNFSLQKWLATSSCKLSITQTRRRGNRGGGIIFCVLNCEPTGHLSPLWTKSKELQSPQMLLDTQFPVIGASSLPFPLVWGFIKSPLDAILYWGIFPCPMILTPHVCNTFQNCTQKSESILENTSFHLPRCLKPRNG